MSGVRVEVSRGRVVESWHRVHVVVAEATGAVRASAGQVDLPTFARSAVKAMQALPLVEDGVVERFGLTTRELALCCASHSGEAYHVEAARSILERIGVGEGALACGPQRPYHEGSAQALRAAGGEAGRIHNNCSGKHAGMLALARFHGWPLEGYHQPDHPVQQRMLVEMERWTGVPSQELETGVDGCGIVTFAVPLAALAGAFARFGAAAARRESGPARVVAAMLGHPEYVAGTDRLCTELMRSGGGRIFAKVGAEGVYCAAVPGAGMGIALKVEDGARRAAEPALLGVLRALGLIGAAEYAALERYAEPELTNTRGEPVGRIRPVVELERHDG